MGKFFEQGLGDFFKSKVNWISMIAVAGGIAGYMTGEIAAMEAVNVVGGGLMGIALKDAVAKT